MNVQFKKNVEASCSTDSVKKPKPNNFLQKLAYNLVLHIKKCFSVTHDKKNRGRSNIHLAQRVRKHEA